MPPFTVLSRLLLCYFFVDVDNKVGPNWTKEQVDAAVANNRIISVGAIKEQQETENEYA